MAILSVYVRRNCGVAGRVYPSRQAHCAHFVGGSRASWLTEHHDLRHVTRDSKHESGDVMVWQETEAHTEHHERRLGYRKRRTHGHDVPTGKKCRWL